MAVAARFGLETQKTAVDALLASERMNALDDVWTGYVANANPSDIEMRERDLPTVQQIADELSEAIASAGALARELRFIFDSPEMDPDTVDRAFGELMDQYPAGTAYLERPELFPDYDLRGAIIESCRYIEETADSARQELAEQVAAFANEQRGSGDIPASLKCAGYLMALGGAVTLVVASHGTALAIGGHAALTGGGAIKQWEKSGCATVLQEIGRFRR
jgi:hypothetical protein